MPSDRVQKKLTDYAEIFWGGKTQKNVLMMWKTHWIMWK